MDKNKIQSLKDTVYLSMYKNHSCFRLRSRWQHTRVSRPLVAVGAAVLQLQEKTRKLLVTAMNRLDQPQKRHSLPAAVSTAQ